MPVFKAYFKVLRKALPGMLLYLAVYMALSVFFTLAAPAASEQFQPARLRVAVINRDDDSPLAAGLTAYLAGTHQLVSYPDDPEQLQDALFYRDLEYIVIIPDGFEAGYLVGNDIALQTVVVPGSTSSHYVDLQIDKYLNTLKLHQQFGRHHSWAELQAAVEKDLANKTPVTVHNASGAADKPGFVYYFGYLAYSLVAIVMLGVSTIMLAFNKPDVQNRMSCGPLAVRKINLQLAAGHAIFALCTWAVMMLLGCALYGSSMLSSELFGWFAANSLVFTAVCVSIGLLVGSLIKNHNAQNAAVNVITLGMSFVCGVFVPQSMLTPSVLAFAKFLPSYWYVRAHDTISATLVLPMADKGPIYGPILIQLGFAAAIFAVTLFLSKERRVSLS